MKYKLLLFLIFLLFNCTYENREEAAPEKVCETENISFNNHIMPILNSSCVGCHNQHEVAGGIKLEEYEEVVKYVENGLLIGAITHSPGFVPMPHNAPKLSECHIQQIQTWIKGGSLNK